ncbi:Putative monooxygenase ydhR [Raoultella terrigena]|uniref:Monooxygenase ydhR n=1 Tax=Raoultella terrigena TaxID=577 RepID=A0A4U9DE43_RAOTE|nr:Putative monooxygenase ydhR [Raoultella terrigena]
MSNKLLQLHFAFNGPFGSEMSRQLVELAESINQEPGFIWKIWTESEKNYEAGGIYLFADEETALAYLTKAYRAPEIAGRRKRGVQTF